MTTHSASGKPELIMLGKCTLQGFAGGVFAAMALLLFYNFCGLNIASFSVVFWAAIPLVVAGVLGAIKAIPFWAVNCFIGTPLRVRTRIIMGGIVSTSFWLYLIIRETPSIEFILISSGAVFLLSLPTSLLIGSRVRVEKFFTFRRGAVPLRLLSTGALLFCVLAVTSWQLLGVDVQQDIMFRYFPLVYFLLSLFLTFKPPRKTVLLLITFSLNLPVVLALHLGSTFQRDYGWPSFETTALVIFCTLLLAAWAIFIATQPGISSEKDIRAGIRPVRTALPLQRDLDHQCLGSRFADWHKRVA